MLVIAHRGAGAYSPHNSRQAFAQAIAMGAQMIETDIRVTRDNVPVLYHDPDILWGPIAQLNWWEIKNYSLANGEFLPSLAEIIQLFGSRIPFNFEIKPLPLAKLDPIITLLKKELKDNCIISSFSPEIIKNINPSIKYQLALLTDRELSKEKLLTTLNQTGASFLNIYYPLLNESLIKNLHGNNYKVIVWTDFLSEIWYPQRLYKLAWDLKCDGFITGKPQLLVNFLRFVQPTS